VSAQLLELSLRTEAFGIGETAIAPVIQLLISVFLARRLHENLKHRRFAMGGRTS
jgi:hypothetical protein